MKIKKEIVIAITVLLVFAAGLAGSQIYKSFRDRNDLATRIRILGAGGPPETIEGLKTAIAAYERQIEAHVRDAAQTGIYYKILAVRLQDRSLHNQALEALQQALYYTPDDATLHYMAGLSLAITAKSHTGFSRTDNVTRSRLYAQAEESYLRAIELDSRYARPLYGLGILYVFELDRPNEAIPHLERYLELSRNDTDSMFVLARAYFVTGEFQKALDVYNRLITFSSMDDTRKTEARNNRQIVMELLNG